MADLLPSFAALAGLELSAERTLDLGYVGTDTALTVRLETSSGNAESLEVEGGTEASTWCAAFEAEHRLRFGYVREGRAIEIKAVRMRITGEEGAGPTLPTLAMSTALGRDGATEPALLRTTQAWFPHVGRVEANVYEREALRAGDRLRGPALILESTGSVVLDPGFELVVDEHGIFRIRSTGEFSRKAPTDLKEADPVRLEVLGNRFMSVAEQMGAVLRNTSVSTNIKERLDYSCAVFDRDGGLVPCCVQSR